MVRLKNQRELDLEPSISDTLKFIGSPTSKQFSSKTYMLHVGGPQGVTYKFDRSRFASEVGKVTVI